jgi:hypothetical protein
MKNLKGQTTSGQTDLLKKSNVSIAVASMISKRTNENKTRKAVGMHTNRLVANTSSSLMGNGNLNLSINTEHYT